MSTASVSNGKHSPIIRLQAARSAFAAAQIACVHWDFEGNDGDGHECCRELEAAARELSLARKAVRS